MTTALMRSGLLPHYRSGKEAHSGLLLQRCLPSHDEKDSSTKGEHIKRVADKCFATDFYKRAFKRWKTATSDEKRFRSVPLNLQSRLFIGLSGGGMLETGCSISHSYGVPYIPGSSVKGVVSAWASERFEGNEGGALIHNELFGAPADGDWPTGLSGVITFHDAWWVPGSAKSPLVPEIVTTHHLDYYGSEGHVEATDFDSPVPNSQVAVRGGFLFTIEGPEVWLDTAKQMLTAALTTRGAGAKTRAGYGLFQEENEKPPDIPLRKGDEVNATFFKDSRDRLRARTDDGKVGAVFFGASAPEDPEEGTTRTLRVRVEHPLEFWWESPKKKPPPRRQPSQPRGRGRR